MQNWRCKTHIVSYRKGLVRQLGFGHPCILPITRPHVKPNQDGGEFAQRFVFPQSSMFVVLCLLYLHATFKSLATFWKRPGFRICNCRVPSSLLFNQGRAILKFGKFANWGIQHRIFSHRFWRPWKTNAVFVSVTKLTTTWSLNTSG